MSITYAETNDAFILYVSETELTDDLHFDMDHSFARAFKKEYRHIIVDLNGAETMNSMFMSVLMNTYIQLRELGGDMSLVNLSPNMRRLLRVVRLDTVFNIYESVEEALRSIAVRAQPEGLLRRPAAAWAAQGAVG